MIPGTTKKVGKDELLHEEKMDKMALPADATKAVKDEEVVVVDKMTNDKVSLSDDATNIDSAIDLVGKNEVIHGEKFMKWLSYAPMLLKQLMTTTKMANWIYLQ